MTPAGDVFVGRQKELAELRAGRSESLGGEGRLFLLSGEPGIGKTRLAEELAAEAGAEGARVLWGRCWEGDGGPALWPWVQCLRSYLADCDPQALGAEVGSGGAILSELLPELREKVPGLGVASVPSDADQARLLLFDATVSFLRAISRRRPVLLILDDLHWADQTTLLLMRFLTRNLRESRILLLGAYRDVEARSATGVAEVLADLTRETRYIALGGLSLEEVRQFIEAAGGVGVSDSVVSQMHAATDGNPFFVGEVVRLLAAEQPGKEWDRSLSGKLLVPTAVGAAIRRHLRALPERSREALAAASVVGREFGLSCLGRVIGRSGQETLESVSEAMRAGIVSRVPDSLDRYRFAHALIRETLYDELSAAERARLHRRVAQALESPAGSGTELPLADLAHHYFEAAVLGEADKAIHYAKLAAEQAMAIFAYEEAARQLERALQILALRQPPDASERWELLLRLGEALSGFEMKRSKEVLFEAARLADRLGDGERLARAALAVSGILGHTHDTGAIDEEQITFCERALELLGEEEGALRAGVTARLSTALHFSTTGEDERARDLAGRAVAIARHIGDKATLVDVLVGTVWARAGPDDYDSGIKTSREIVALATELGDRPNDCYGHVATFVRLVEIGDAEASDQEAERIVDLCGTRRDSFARLAALMIPGVQALVGGRFEEAGAVVRRILSVAEETQSAIAFQSYLLQLILIRWEQARLEEILGDLQNVADRLKAIPAGRCCLTWVNAELGRAAQAVAILETLAESDFVAIPRDYNWLAAVSFLGQAAARLGHLPRVAALYELLRPYADRFAMMGMHACYGPVAWTLGLLATTVSRYDEADAHFELALEKTALLRAWPWLAHTQHDYARMLLARRGPGDVEKASELASRALATARDLGMKPLEERLLALGVTGSAAKIAGVFRKEGEFWTIRFDGTTFRLRDAKGLHYIAALLGQPRIELHAAELAGLERGAMSLGDAGQKLDAKAREAYRRRLEDLRDQAEEAERFNDPTRAAKARAEMEAIQSELSAAFGLGGRSRRAASDAERARLMVTQRIKAALRKITESNPALGRHLSKSIRTGLFCSYEPQERVIWEA